ncbi:MAG TPA: two-component regulator propeller domain-containing protein [Flavobacteriales bacterium]
MRLRLPAAILAAAIGVGTVAQQYGFRSYTPRDGLAQSQVRCMAQDQQGYLWFGTLGGASRFDGDQFTNYALQEGMPDAQVNALLSTSDGLIWMACGAHLATFDGHRLRTVPLPPIAHDRRMLALAETRNGDVLIGTDGAGVLSSHQGIIAPLSGYPADTATSVRALLALPDGGLLIGLRNGLLRWREGKCEQVEAVEGSSVSALALGHDGTIWVGTYGDGVIGLGVDGSLRTYDPENGLSQNNVRSLMVDRDARLWIGTKFGVNVLDGTRIRTYTVHQGMPNDNIWGLFQDRSGGIWLGTDGAGVLRYAGERFVTFTIKDGLCSDLVMCMVADHRKDIWLGTYGSGICRSDGMAIITTNDGLPNNTVWCALATPDSALWFGTSEGLAKVVRGKVVPLDSAWQLRGQRVLALHRTADGTLWCGTRDGLVRLAPEGQVETLSRSGDVPLRAVRALTETRDGSLWLATDQGLVRLSGTTTQRWSAPDGLSDNTVFCIHPDRHGRIWAGTANGLNCIDGERTVTVKLGADFGSNYIGSLLSDAAGDLWVGTNSGLYHFDPDSLLVRPDLFEHFTTDDGLRGMESNLNASFRDARQRLFFGTNGGLVLHDPDRGPPPGSEEALNAHITGIRSFLLPTDWSTMSDSLSERTGLPMGLKLPFRKNHLTFDYTAVALSDAERVRFQYRLEGFDPGWLPATDARFATYSNLPHGEYTFEVRATDRPGAWGPVQRFSFHIAPPFWLRWWFFVGCGLVLLASGTALVHYRHVRRTRREKTRQLMLRSRMLQLEQQALNANMNRHFIFNALNSIQYYINRQDRTAANRYLTSFAKLIRKNLDASQSDTVTLHEELARLELYLLLEHMRFKDKFRYEVNIRPGVDTRDIDIPAMMLQPYVENSIWHGILPTGRPGLVTIVVSPLPNERVRVRIADDGIGIERSIALKNGAEGDHISRGIEITKGRADVLRRLDLADIRITGPEQVRTEGATGTQVLIDLPTKHHRPAAPQDLHERGIPPIFVP